jgi:hypothetical protein
VPREAADFWKKRYKQDIRVLFQYTCRNQ